MSPNHLPSPEFPEQKRASSPVSGRLRTVLTGALAAVMTLVGAGTHAQDGKAPDAGKDAKANEKNSQDGPLAKVALGSKCMAVSSQNLIRIRPADPEENLLAAKDSGTIVVNGKPLFVRLAMNDNHGTAVLFNAVTGKREVIFFSADEGVHWTVEFPEARTLAIGGQGVPRTIDVFYGGNRFQTLSAKDGKKIE